MSSYYLSNRNQTEVESKAQYQMIQIVNKNLVKLKDQLNEINIGIILTAYTRLFYQDLNDQLIISQRFLDILDYTSEQNNKLTMDAKILSLVLTALSKFAKGNFTQLD